MKKAIRSLITLPKRSIVRTEDLKISEKVTNETYDNISATIFGGSSQVGISLGPKLWLMGTRTIYPYRTLDSQLIGRFRELRLHKNPGTRSFVHLSDFTDVKELELVMRYQNAVINCIGNRFYYYREYDYELANIIIPTLIAKAVKRTPTVRRFIHFSAAGADPNSPSLMLRTKWYGEQAVKEICPDAIILKPTVIYNTINPDSCFIGRWIATLRITSGTGITIGDGTAKIQPVLNRDVALAVINCLKMPETKGQTYELGGPVVYTYKEAYETLFNMVNMKPYMVSVPAETAFEYYESPAFTSLIVNLLLPLENHSTSIHESRAIAYGICR